MSTKLETDLTIPSGMSDASLDRFEAMKRRVRVDAEFRERVAERYGSKEVIEVKESATPISDLFDFLLYEAQEEAAASGGEK